MKFCSLTLFCIVATAIATTPFKIDFKVRRGSSKDNLTPEDEDSSARFVKRDGSFEMILINEQTFYMANLQIGSNQDENNVLVDTGSSDLWVVAHDLNCISSRDRKRSTESFKQGTGVVNHLPLKKREPQVGRDHNVIKPSKTVQENKIKANNNNNNKQVTGASAVYITYGGVGAPTDLPNTATLRFSTSNTCTSYGTFNTENSDTFIENDTYPFLIEYADNTHAIGVWGYDNVMINNVTVNNLTFAIANEASSDVGVLGIGLPGLEVTSQYGYSYANLPIKLVQEGIINKAVYSLYLNTADAEAGTILFGAIDHAKYEGELVTVDMMRTYRQLNYPVRIQIPVTEMSYTDDEGNTENVLSDSTGVVLDTGSTLSYVFSDTLRQLGRLLGGTYSSYYGAYIIDCGLEDSSGSLDINFGGNKTILVPISELVLRFESQCFLGILEQSSSSSYMLFGDNILRSAYVVYNLEDYQVSLAQVFYTDEESIEILSSDGIRNTSGVETDSFSFSLRSPSSTTRSSSSTTRSPLGTSITEESSGTTSLAANSTLSLASDTTTAPSSPTSTSLQGSGGDKQSTSLEGIIFSMLVWVYFAL